MLLLSRSIETSLETEAKQVAQARASASERKQDAIRQEDEEKQRMELEKESERVRNLAVLQRREEKKKEEERKREQRSRQRQEEEFALLQIEEEQGAADNNDREHKKSASSSSRGDPKHSDPEQEPHEFVHRKYIREDDFSSSGGLIAVETFDSVAPLESVVSGARRSSTFDAEDDEMGNDDPREDESLFVSLVKS